MSRQVSRNFSFLFVFVFPPFGFYCYFLFSLYSQCLKKTKNKKKKQKKKERENYKSWGKIQKQMKKSASLIFFMAAATWKCCCHSTGSGYTIQLCTSLQCHFIQSHICRVHVLLAVTSHLHFWQNDWDLLFLRATAVTGGGMDTKIRVCTESWPWRRKFFHHSGGDLNPRPFDHKSGTELPIKNQVHLFIICKCRKFELLSQAI